MTNETNGLFRPEIYEAMQKELKSPSRDRGVEEALDMISSDKRMNDFFRNYAKKEGIYSNSTFSFRTRTKDDLSLFIAGGSENKSKWVSAQERREGIYLGPRQDKYPLLFVYAHNGNIIRDESCGFSYGSFLKKTNGWVIDIPSYAPRSDEYPSRVECLVSHAPLFNLSKQDILTGLENAIKKLLEERN